jgi:hypothetical protein
MDNKEFSMKNLLKLLGLITLVAVIGFSMIACDTGGWAFGSRTAPSPGPGPGGPSEEVVLFEDGEWIAALGDVTLDFTSDNPGTDPDDTFIITFENPIDLTDCTKLILEFTSGTMANQYWHGGQLALLNGPGDADDEKLNYWGNGVTTFASLIWTFELTKPDTGSDALTELEEIKTKSWTAQPVLSKVYLDKTAVAPPPPPPPPPPPGEGVELPILFDGTDWATDELGTVTITVSNGNTVIVLENAVDISGYSKLVVEGVDASGWYLGGQLGNMGSNVQNGYWSGITLETGGGTTDAKASFDLSLATITEVDEIVIGTDCTDGSGNLTVTSLYLE